MKIRPSFVSALALIAATATPASAATTWLVPGNGTNTCTTISPNCNTIAQAVTASSSGDTISIGAGTFAVSSTIVLTKTLTIAGAGNTSTFVQPGAGVTGFSVRTSNIVLRDFAIQNGGIGIAFQSASSTNTQITRASFSGQTLRGIDISLAATLTVSNVAIADCTIATSGIGLRTSSTAQVSGLTITGTTFSGNTYGIYVANDNGTSKFSGLTIQNSTFTNNVNYGIYAEEMRDVVIEDSSFTGGSTGIGLLKFYGSNGVAASNITIRRDQFTAFTANALDLEVYLGGTTPAGVGLENPITIQDNTIQKNVGIQTSSPAVFVRLPAQLTNAAVDILDNDITLSGTFVSGASAHAIQLRGNGPVVITGNTLDGGNVGGSATNPPTSGVFVESQAGSTSLPSGTFSNVMPATASITGSCNRIQNFHDGVSVFNTVGGVYGGLPAGATVSFENDAVVDNDVAGAANGATPTLDFTNNWWGCVAGPGNPGCDGVIGGVDSSSNTSAPPACVACLDDADCSDGLFCTGVETCNGSHQCVAGTNPCLGGDVCGNVCNEVNDSCVVPNGTPCRASAGPCDAAETCDGVTTSCPADGFAPPTTLCRAAAGECDADDYCSGAGVTCPDGKQGGGTACSSDGNPCTLDQCDGSSNACQHPAGNAGAVCRPSAGVCDVAETCDGTSSSCPADGFAPSTTVCRSSGGVCDVAETCTGNSASCPADGFAPPTTVCRPSAGVCDVAETCSGASASCPADGFAPSTTICRAQDGVCDVAETCTGTSASCPADGFAPSTTVCRPSAGVCDVAETCTGASTSCPTDAFASSTTVCRAAAGQCDVAETCTGAGAACPVDASQLDGTACDDGVACTINDVCTAGVCGGNSMTCGDGVVQSGCGELCDDGNLVSGDGCSATCQPEFVCTPTPLTGCRTAASGKSQLQLKDKTPDSKDQSKWKWNKGATTPKADFGAPLATTDYQFCIYAGGALVSRAHMPAGGTCAGKPCWKENAKGFQYKDKDATPDGVTQLKLKEGTVDGKAQIQLKGKGVNVDMPTLPLAEPVLVQLRNSDGVCWETTFSAPAQKNDPTQFKDKND